ncbi:hypothetical protein SAMN06265379_10690 [Saccharicrinis carchari]|uniref:Tetratricopeptide repeat-containing protein n=1 Tax=Saccharicrinis carchari TaxID=1168039 RepID=A0A521DR79_SACCC|nr:DUF6340 family protein [Saccharicrinis carchari]SMO74217.1 hypothetical protein SAMN06265379_10690 [Saccharicrinis carchari]
MLIKRFLILFLIALLGSCASYEVLNIDVLKPAKHTFQPQIKSVVLVDNSIPFRGKDVNKVQTPTSKFSVDTIWFDDFSTRNLGTLKEEMQVRMFFDSVYLHPDRLKSDDRLVNRALSWQQVNALCEQYNAQAVIALERYIYDTKIQVDRSYDGGLYGYMDASGVILWRAYNNLTKELIYKETQVDTISWDAIGGNIEQVARQLPTIKGGLEELAIYLGEQAANHSTPIWEAQLRGYYATGTYHFLQATEFVRQNQWGEAIKLWKYAFDHSKKKTKARAAYNLALASEMLDDYESAQYWLDQATEALSFLSGQSVNVDKKRIISYSFYMNKRRKEIKDLKQQIGGVVQ